MKATYAAQHSRRYMNECAHVRRCTLKLSEAFILIFIG